MKKKSLYLAIILTIIVAVYACYDDQIDDLLKDYRFKTEIVNLNGQDFKDLYMHTETDFAIDIQKTSDIGSYKLSYTQEEGEGVLKYHDTIIEPGISVSCKEDRLKFRYIPASPGDHRLLFKLSNEAVNVTERFEGQASKLYFQTEVIKLPTKPLIDKQFTFNLKLKKAADATTAKSFATSVTVLDGAGEIVFQQIDTLQTDSTQKKFFARSNSKDQNYLVEGENQLSYISRKAGKNILQFQVTNSLGFSQSIDVPIDVYVPDFSVETITDTVADAGATNNFLLKVTDTDNHGQNIYQVAYRNLQNSGKLRINNNELQVGSTLQLQKGENICEFIPMELGEAALEFIVKDKYNSVKKDTAYFKVQKSETNINISDHERNITVYNTQNFNFAVNKKNYKGNYRFEIIQNPLNSVAIKVNGEDYKGGQVSISSPQNTLVSFIPSRPGDLKLTLKVYDDYNSESTSELNYTVENTQGKITISNHQQTLNLLESNNFNFAVSKPNYDQAYQFEITQFPINGTIKINGKDYTGGRVDITNPLNTLVSYTPMGTGETTLTLTAYDVFGGSFQETLHYTVSNTGINISINNIEKGNIIFGRETTFDFTPTKEFYTGDLRYEISMHPESAGKLKVDGQPYSNFVGSYTTTPAGRKSTISFTPEKEGEVTLVLRVYDTFGGETSSPVTYNVTNPRIKMEVQNYSANAILNTENLLTFAVNKESYSGNFFYSISTTPPGSGLVKVNGKKHEGGKNTLEKPGNTSLSFTPSKEGDTELNLTITDEIGGILERVFSYKSTNPPLNLQVSNLAGELTVMKQTTFMFAVNKTNYPGDFYYQISNVEGASEIKVNATEYIASSRVKVPIPTGTSVSFIPTRTGEVKFKLQLFDDWGKTIEKDLVFTVTNSDITLNVTNVESKLFVGKATTFNFLASKLNYTGNLKYEIISTPESMGSLVVNGENYVSGKIEFQAGKEIPVIFTPEKEGEVSFKVIISDEFGGEKSQTINHVITNPAIQLEVTNYTTEAVINTEKSFNFSTKKEQYPGSFNYSITTTPAGSGILKINDKIYTGGVIQLEKPGNTKVSFTPSMAGEVVLTLNVTDNVGGKAERTFTYNVSNPELELMLANLEPDLTLDKTTSFNFAINKANYTGKFNAIITGENCKDIKLNDIPYSQNTPQEVSRAGTRVSFTPTATGTAVTKLHLTITDDWGKSVEKELTFNVANSTIVLQVKNVSTKGYVGADSKFNFRATKPNYTGNLKYEIVSVPEETGALVVDGENYVSGKIEFQAGKEIPVIFTPEKEGEVSFKINISDEFGGETSETITQSITNPRIKTEIIGFVPEANLNVTNGFNFSVTKDYYSGKYNYIITTNPTNAAEIKVNDITYSGGLTELTNPANTRVTIKPLIAGKVTLDLIVMDETGSRWEKAFEYNIANNPLQLIVSNQETALTLDKETSFNFAVSKANYTGKYIYEITSEPVVAGTLKVNGTNYEGGKVVVDNPTNTKVTFIPSKTGATYLTVKVEDDFGGKAEQRLPFSVANSKFSIITSNVEKTIQAGKATVFNYSTVKENYTGKYQQEIIITPEGAGEIKINGNSYPGGKIDVTNPVNTIVEYTPKKAGQNTLQLKLYDEAGGEAVTNITYNCVNPDIVINTTNKEDALIYNTRTNFNVSLSKKFYTGNYKYRVEQIPANSGTLYINDIEYDGSINQVANPDNLKIGFVPTREGHVSLKLQVFDDIEGTSEEIYNFNVTNPELIVNVTNHTPDVKVNNSTTFNFTATKANYPGKLTYQIEQIPAGVATLKVNEATYSGGKLELQDPLDNPVEFTASKTGAVVLKLTVEDEWGKKVVKDIPFSVVNTDIAVNITNKEQDLSLNKTTALNFTVSKPGYSGTFKAKILDEENSGKLKVNNNACSFGEEIKLSATNSLEFIPTRAGAVLLKLQVTDELGGEKEVALSFNVTNPEITVRVTNKEDELIYNTRTNFNIALSKEYYTGTYNYEIEQVPANSGSILVDDVAYPGGSVTATNHSNIRVGFVPNRAGRVSLKFRFTESTGGEAIETLDFNVTNPDITLNVTGQTKDIKVNTPTTFNFAVAKANYTGKFQYQIEQTPASSGTIKVNGVAYPGGKIDIENINSNPVEFVANKTGAVTLKLTVTDEWGKQVTRDIPYSVSNTDILANITNKEFDLMLNKSTTLNFTVSKPNYTGGFKAEITPDPAAAGTIKLNNSVYTSGKVNLQANNTIQFTPSQSGAVLLTLKIHDDLGGEKEIPLNFNVANPAIEIAITNKESSVIYKSTTTFNAAISKPNYTGKFRYRISTTPAAAGAITIGGKAHDGNYTDVASPAGLQVGFTPVQEGYVSLLLEVEDETGSKTEKNIDFSVTNPALNLTINNTGSDLTLGSTHSFSISASKQGYTGGYTYEITQYPYAAGDMTVGGSSSLSGKLTSNPTNVTFKPNRLGAIVLNVKISDEWGKNTEKQLDFNVENSPITLAFLNNQSNIVLNNATSFNFKATKANYGDDETMTYSITPATSMGTLTVDGKAYNGTGVSVTYGKIKNGVPVTFTPSREGVSSLTFMVTDSHGTTTSKTVDFNVTNPKLSLFLSGVNTSGTNEVTLGETFKYTFNVDKPNYTDDFGYMITLEPADAGTIATSDITPRSLGVVTGTLQKGSFGVSTGEIRFTPSNSSYLNRNVKINVEVRDKWGNKKETTTTFTFKTSAINVNMNRKTSIPVEEPYMFYFTVDKAGYSGKFTYQFTGWNEGDKIETSPDGTSYNVYNGGKFELPHKDHTYIRYTPAKTGTVPLRLFVYDENNVEVMRELTFDVKVPKVKFRADRTTASGHVGELIPFKLTATEEKGEDLNVTFSLESANFNGALRFNGSEVTPSAAKGRAAGTTVITNSGKVNTFEIMSRKSGNYATTTTAQNRWGSKAAVTTSISVTEKPRYTISTSTIGNGTVSISPSAPDHEAGTEVTITATPAKGWKLVRWQGSASGSTNPLQVTVSGDMNIVAVFEKEYDPSYVNVSGYIEIQGKGNGTYFIPTNALAPNIYLAKPNTTTNDVFYLQGLPREIKSGNKAEFNPFKMDLNSEYTWIQVHIMLSEISNFSITSGEIVIVDKDTGKNIPVKSTFYSTGALGAFACTIDIPKENPLMYETLRDNNVQNMEVRIIFKE